MADGGQRLSVVGVDLHERCSCLPVGGVTGRQPLIYGCYQGGALARGCFEVGYDLGQGLGCCGLGLSGSAHYRCICVGRLRHRCVEVNTPHAHSPLQKVVIFLPAADARSDAALEMAAGSRRVSASRVSRIPLRYAAMASASWVGVEGPPAARIASSATSAEACARVRAATVIGSSHCGVPPRTDVAHGQL